MLHHRGLARILTRTSPADNVSPPNLDSSNQTKTYNLRRIIFGNKSNEEVQDLYAEQAWGLIETSVTSGDRIVVCISGDLKRERIRGTTLPLYDFPENS
jgi:hypothetical protein